MFAVQFEKKIFGRVAFAKFEILMEGQPESLLPAFGTYTKFETFAEAQTVLERSKLPLEHTNFIIVDLSDQE